MDRAGEKRLNWIIVGLVVLVVFMASTRAEAVHERVRIADQVVAERVVI